MISVAIATLDRAFALREISLPSLLRQEYADFEVIVWDASENDESEKVCEVMRGAFEVKGAALRYFKAPRRGTASQRNDAVATAEGDIIFFFDDDCEMSVDSLSALSACFASLPLVPGAGIPLLNRNPESGNSRILGFATLLFGMKNNQLRRKINSYGGLSLPIKDLPGTAEWLSGGSMGFRREVFEKLRLDERLETFDSYALGEDYDFSHRVMLEYGEPLMVTNGGYVIHHSAPGKKLAGVEKIAAHFFNASLIRMNFGRYGKRFGLVSRAWGAFGTILMLMYQGTSPLDIVKGVKMASREIRKYRT